MKPWTVAFRTITFRAARVIARTIIALRFIFPNSRFSTSVAEARAPPPRKRRNPGGHSTAPTTSVSIRSCPVRTWAAQRQAFAAIRYPKGRRPTGVKSGDNVFLVIHSREPGGEPEMYIVGCAKALAYRPLVDDASDDIQASDRYLARFPHALRLEAVRFIRGAVGEGVPAYPMMNSVGPKIFMSTERNAQKGEGNVDPHKSIAQKAMVLLSTIGATETNRLLDARLQVLGCVSGKEIAVTVDAEK